MLKIENWNQAVLLIANGQMYAILIWILPMNGLILNAILDISTMQTRNHDDSTLITKTRNFVILRFHNRTVALSTSLWRVIAIVLSPSGVDGYNNSIVALSSIPYKTNPFIGDDNKLNLYKCRLPMLTFRDDFQKDWNCLYKFNKLKRTHNALIWINVFKEAITLYSAQGVITPF